MYTLGSIPISIDENRLGFPLTSASRRTTIFRNFALGPVYDQGDKPICVDCALRGLLAAEPVKQSPFKESEIYHAARKLDETSESIEGSKLNFAVEFLKNKGIVRENFWTNKSYEVVDYLNKISPIVFSLPWYEKMNDPEKDGNLIPKGKLIGFHAVLGFRYDGLKNKIYIRNSWGKKWGVDGNAYLSLINLDKLMNDGGIACALVE